MVIAERLGASKVNALAGRRLPALPESTQLACLTEQLAEAADRLATVGVAVNTELLNPIENAGFLLSDLARTRTVIDCPRRTGGAAAGRLSPAADAG